MATSLEGFSVTSHEKRVPGPPFEGIKRVRGAPPGTKNQGGHVKSPDKMSAPGKWGRTQMGPDGFNRILTGF